MNRPKEPLSSRYPRMTATTDLTVVDESAGHFATTEKKEFPAAIHRHPFSVVPFITLGFEDVARVKSRANAWEGRDEPEDPFSHRLKVGRGQSPSLPLHSRRDLGGSASHPRSIDRGPSRADSRHGDSPHWRRGTEPRVFREEACRAGFHTLGREAGVAAPPGERIGPGRVAITGAAWTRVLAGTRG